MDDVVKTTGDFIGAVYDYINDKIGGLYNTVRSWVGELVGGISGTIANTIDGIKDWFTSLINAISSWLKNVYNSLEKNITSVIGGVQNWLYSAYTGISSWIQGTYENIGRWINDVVNAAKNWISDAYKNVSGWIRDAIGNVGNWLKDAYSNVSNWIKNAYTDVSKWVSNAVETVKHAVDVLVSQLVEAWDKLSERFIDISKRIDEGFIKPFTSLLGGEVKGFSTLVHDLFNTICLPLFTNPAVPGNVSKLANHSTWLTFNMASLMVLMAVPMYMNEMISAASVGNIERVAQYSRAMEKSGVLSSNDVVNAERRGIISSDWATVELSRQGLSPEQHGVLYGLSQSLIGVGDVVALYRRGTITEEELQSRLIRLGYSVEDTGNILNATQAWPSLSDMVLFAVREVFDPAQAENLGLFQDMPEEFVNQAVRIGLDPYWAKAYWGAHWQLPSPQMGFEMLHRGIIDQNQLNGLLKALDYSPVWRDKLTAISYNPLTRVDVRNMFERGLVSRERVYRNYLDLGYTPTDAELLTQFAEKLRDESQKGATQTEKDLTRSQIESAYKRGMISEENAKALLIDIGYDDSEASFMTASIDYDKAITRRDALIQRIIKRYQIGEITENEVKTELTALALTSSEIEDVMLDLDTVEAKEPKGPTLAQLQQFYKRNLITQDEFITEVERLGYPEKWALLYAKLPKSETIQ